jgi:hypothetical protein
MESEDKIQRSQNRNYEVPVETLRILFFFSILELALEKKCVQSFWGREGGGGNQKKTNYV